MAFLSLRAQHALICLRSVAGSPLRLLGVGVLPTPGRLRKDRRGPFCAFPETDIPGAYTVVPRESGLEV